MKPFLIAIIILIPCLCFGQKNTSDYDIYSEYFRVFQKQHGGEYNFVIKVKPGYNPTEEDTGISSFLYDVRGDIKEGKIPGSFVLNCPQLIDTLKKDTSWLLLIDQLNKGLKKQHTIRNAFSKDIRVSMFTYGQYAEYFENKEINEGWANFHDDYPGHSVLTTVSDIASDGRRAVFYFSWRCGGLCGDGSLVMFYKDASGWKYLCSITLWQT